MPNVPPPQRASSVEYVHHLGGKNADARGKKASIHNDCSNADWVSGGNESRGRSAAAVRWRADAERSAVVRCFESRGWTRCDNSQHSANDFDVYWASVKSCRAVFNPENGFRLAEHQRINHFPNHFELTRKDLMVKNIKRYRKEAGRFTASSETGSEVAASAAVPDFIPTTYVLPSDYSLFVDTFKQHPSAAWIMKPTDKAQGTGIFLVNKLSQIKKWANSRWKGYNSNANAATKELYVISRYIDSPLLIGGKKFDIRLYVLVTSYRPLKSYVYQDGFARFCNTKYSSDLSQHRDNMFMHLTNVAVQKRSDEYSKRHGNKWGLDQLKLYLEATVGFRKARKVFRDIDDVIAHSLKAVKNVMINDRHCFECYGYDIILDDQLKPWLIEVNASPALSATTEKDAKLKRGLIDDVMRIVFPDGTHHRGARRRSRTPTPPPPGTNGPRDAEEGSILPNHHHRIHGNKSAVVGKFHLLIDESVVMETTKKTKRRGSAEQRHNHWK